MLFAIHLVVSGDVRKLTILYMLEELLSIAEV